VANQVLDWVQAWLSSAGRVAAELSNEDAP
jgi:hypothetical protein